MGQVKPIIASILVVLLFTASLPLFAEKAAAANGDIIVTAAGNGSAGSSGDGDSATDAEIKDPRGIAFDSDGNLYIADSGGNRVRKVDKDTGVITTVAGTGAQGFGGDGYEATSAQLAYPTGIAFDAQDNLYISDNGNNRVRRVDADDGIITTFAGNGVYVDYDLDVGDGLPAPSAELSSPRGLAFDADGNLYIAESGNNRIRRVDTLGVISTFAGTGIWGQGGYAGDGDLATLAKLNFPMDVAFDAAGNLYIADSNNNRIRMVDKTTRNISTVAGQGYFGWSPDGTLAVDAYVGNPTGLAFDAGGNLFISDFGISRVLRIDTAGKLSTVAGNGGFGYSGDGGVATAASLNFPMAVAVDGSGTMHVADASNNRIRRLASSNNANLSGLTLSSGTLSPTLSSGTTSYTASVTLSVNSITVTPTVSDVDATVTVDSAPVTSGTASGAINLSVGANPIPIEVTAHDGTKKTYTVTVTRASDDASLSGLTLSSGSISPTFASGTSGYTASVANGVNSITVTPTVSDGNAAVTVKGMPVASGTASNAINLNVGANAIPVVVTAQNGTTTSTYTVTVTRAPSSDASLSGLTLSSGSLSPAFASGTANYTTSVANGVGSITVTPTTNEGHATVTVDGAAATSGSASGAIHLNVGPNAIPIVVTAQDGTTSTYTVTVTRAAAATGGAGVGRSNDARLIGLTLSSGSLSRAFASGTTSYTVSVAYDVSSMTVTPSVSDRAATVKVNGVSVPIGSASGTIGLNVGDNLISVTVTAEDGTTMSYAVTVTRASEEVAPPASRGPFLNEKMANAPKVKEASTAALHATAYRPFADVAADDWSFQAVQAAQRLGIVQGRPDGNFHGGDSITRAEFAAMVANALYLDTAGGSGTTFSDTKGHWAEPAIRALTAAGVVEGIGDGAFKPDRSISRAEISAILARLMIFDESAGNVSFSDTTGNWARQWIELLAGADVVAGEGEGKFNPSAYATREQAVAMILRMLTVCRNVDLQWVDQGGSYESSSIVL